MSGRWAAGIRPLAAVTLGAACLFSVACNSTPTEPSSQVLMTAIAEVQAPGTGNTLTVKANVCGCSRAALDIEIDGSVAGTVGCGEERSFTIATSVHTVKIYSATLERPLVVTATGNDSRGTLIRITCS